MWLFTKHGFFSIVTGRNAGEIQIRARDRADLVRLVSLDAAKQSARLGRAVASLAITDTGPPADYAARVVVREEIWLERIAPLLINSIDYDNFKNRVAIDPEQKARIPHYAQVWRIMADYQDGRTPFAYTEEELAEIEGEIDLQLDRDRDRRINQARTLGDLGEISAIDVARELAENPIEVDFDLELGPRPPRLPVGSEIWVRNPDAVATPPKLVTILDFDDARVFVDPPNGPPVWISRRWILDRCQECSKVLDPATAIVVTPEFKVCQACNDRVEGDWAEDKKTLPGGGEPCGWEKRLDPTAIAPHDDRETPEATQGKPSFPGDPRPFPGSVPSKQTQAELAAIRRIQPGEFRVKDLVDGFSIDELELIRTRAQKDRVDAAVLDIIDGAIEQIPRKAKAAGFHGRDTAGEFKTFGSVKEGPIDAD